MKTVFFTYSDKSCARLKYRAIETGWFDSVSSAEKIDGKKFDVILDAFRKSPDRSAFVYADQFSEINLNGKLYFVNNVERLREKPIVLYGTEESPFEEVMYLKKCKDSESFLVKCSECGFDEAVNAFKKKISFVKPSYDFFYCSEFRTSEEVRLAKSDFLPNCKRHYYSPYSMFLIGHELPCYDVDLDSYTHFINVGKDDLQRCTVDSGDNINKHQELAELCGIYWAWKNLDMSDLKYVGFSTYRKPFVMSSDAILKALDTDEADCIANRYYRSFKAIHLNELGEEAVAAFAKTVSEVLPADEANDIMNTYDNDGAGYICNSFVIHRDKLSELCEKIFKLAVPLAERMKGKTGEKEHRPWAGCFAEFVTSYYIKKTFSKIKTSAFFIYPKYSRLLARDLPSIDPMIYGTVIDNGNPLFFAYGDYAKKTKEELETLKNNEKPVTEGAKNENDFRVKKISITATKYENINSLMIVHAGFTGDLMYAVPMLSELKEHTKCDLKLHIQTNVTSNLAFEHPNGNVRMTEGAAKFIKPLLDEMKLFDEVTYGDEVPATRLKLDLSNFYKLPINHSAGNMQQWYYNYVSTHLPQDFAKKRIEVEASDELKDKVVVVYSKRYVNERITLKPIEKFKDHFVFIGLDDEYETFKERWFYLEHRKVSDALEFAKLLAGSKGIICNQTWLFSIAELMKVPRVLITAEIIKANDKLIAGPVNVQPCGGWFEVVEIQNKLMSAVDGLMRP